MSIQTQLKNLPQKPGVYIFRDKDKKILYIGKATSLKNRISSYFSGAHNYRIEKMISRIEKIEIKKTDTVLEALILEANLIKKHQPKYNIKEKDDKSFSYFVITKEEFSRILILRATELEKYQISSDLNVPPLKATLYNVAFKGGSVAKVYGPYTSKKQMQIALKIIRKIFPFHSLKQKTEKGCLDFQIGLCPGPYAGKINKRDYQRNIRGIRMILEGKKKSLLKKMEKEMKEYSAKREFEKAGEMRNKIFALQHIQDIAFLQREESIVDDKLKNIRIEAFDISNISGAYAVGAMVVFKNYEPEKSGYRKFKIKSVRGVDDVAMMREVLERRFGNDWQKPDLIFLDGGKGHLAMAKRLLDSLGLKIPIVAVAKGPTRKKLDLYFANCRRDGDLSRLCNDENLIGRIMGEVHRFAISYHRKLIGKRFKKVK
ncbi:MAG: GIY-YIG nuclease family protein [Candidatus Pacebacteria bacterium]|nr:GIY-YIG nuclease family protein [Candidatus Paceibacterota bacterium]